MFTCFPCHVFLLSAHLEPHVQSDIYMRVDTDTDGFMINRLGILNINISTLEYFFSKNMTISIIAIRNVITVMLTVKLQFFTEGCNH